MSQVASRPGQTRRLRGKARLGTRQPAGRRLSPGADLA